MTPPGPPGRTLDEQLRALVREVLREELATVVRREFGIAMREVLPSLTAKLTDTEYVSAARAAEIAGVTPATVRGWMRLGKLRPHRAGRLARVRVDELRAFLGGEASLPTPAVDIDARARTILAKRHRASSRAPR